MENECLYVNSRGILKSCDIHSPSPTSSWCYDRDYLNKMILDNNIFENMSIYVCSDIIPYFVSDILPKMTANFYLFTGDSDAFVPGGHIDLWNYPRDKYLLESTCLELANNPKLIRWYSQNCILFHEKVEQLPIGLDYHTISNEPQRNWRGKNEGTSPFEQEAQLIEFKNSSKPYYCRKYIDKIYVNFYKSNDRVNQRVISLENISNNLLEIKCKRELFRIKHLKLKLGAKRPDEVA
jgi:hypothetical protein